MSFEQCFKKFPAALPQMSKRGVALAGVLCYLVANFGQSLAVAGGEFTDQKYEAGAFGVGEQQQFVRVDQVTNPADVSGVVSEVAQQFHHGESPDDAHPEAVETPAPAHVPADQPSQKRDDGNQLNVGSDPCKNCRQDTEKLIHDTFLLSVFLIFMGWIFTRK